MSGLQISSPSRAYFSIDETSTTSNQLCVPEMISKIENITGTLNFQDVGSNDVFNDAAKDLTSSILNLTCTSCIQAAYTVVRQDFPDAVSEVTGPLGSLCGSSFVGESGTFKFSVCTPRD